jgi:hypothetical protein
MLLVLCIRETSLIRVPCTCGHACGVHPANLCGMQQLKVSFGSSPQDFLHTWEKGPEEHNIIELNFPAELLEQIALQLPIADAICLASANRHCRDALRSEE